ncbi:unnamed protein product [Cunninghamella echinulata]
MQNFLNRRSWVSRSGTVSPINNSTTPTAANNNKKRPLSEFVQRSNQKVPQSSSVNLLIPSLSQLNLLPPSTTLTNLSSTKNTSYNNGLYILDSSYSLTSSSASSASSSCSTSSIPVSPTSLASDNSDFIYSKNNNNINSNTMVELPPPEFTCPQQIQYPFTFDYVIPESANVLHGTQPVKMLLERLETWDYITKCLHNQFEALTAAEVQFVKAYQKFDNVLDFDKIFDDSNNVNTLNNENNEIENNINENNNDSINTEDDNINSFPKSRSYAHHQYTSLVQAQFSKTGGIRQICDTWQSYHTKSAKDHAEYATFIHTKGLSLLTNIKHELKTIIKSIRSNDRLSIIPLSKLKDEAARRLHKLAQQLAYFDRYPDNGSTKEDPWLINTRVVKQVMKVYQQENKMHEAIVILQREVMTLEKQIIEELRNFFTELYKLREESSLGIDRGMEQLLQIVNNVANDQDWIYFSQHCKNQLISEYAVYRHPDKLQYPNHSHPLVHPLYAASMERRSSVLHNWSEYIYVLTPAGFLHEYRNPKSYPSHPTSTIFIPDYNVTTLSSKIHHHDLTFQLQPTSSSSSLSTTTQPIEALNGGKEMQPFQQSFKRNNNRSRKNITLRAKCANDMQIWLEHLTNCSQKYRPKIQFRQPIVDDDDEDEPSAGITSPQSIHQEMAKSHGTLSPVVAYPMTPRPGTYVLKSPTFTSIKSPTFSSAMKSSANLASTSSNTTILSPSTKNSKPYRIVHSNSHYIQPTSK